MKYIKTNCKINLDWQVMKGIGNVEEDFSRSTVSLFLVKDGTENRYTISCTAGASGRVRAEIAENTLPVGVYGVELVWLKNEGHAGTSRCVNRTRKACVFGIDSAVNDTEQPVTVKMKTTAASYGYDGLSSWELAVLKGQTTLSENEYIQNLTDQSEAFAELRSAVAGKAGKNGSRSEAFAASTIGANEVTAGGIYANWIYRADQGVLGGGILIPTVNQGEQDELALKTNLLQYCTSAAYDSSTQRINFLNSVNEVLAYIDATAFIKDGMVSNVAINNGNLVITFNTDAGQSPISLPLTDIFNPANYYTKTQVDALLRELEALRPLTVTIGINPEEVVSIDTTYSQIAAAFTNDRRVIVDFNCAPLGIRFSAGMARVAVMRDGVAVTVFTAHTYYIDNDTAHHLMVNVYEEEGQTKVEYEEI